ncbi:hypothetical protein SAY87_004237 [Trapa incisa]|uniref:Uncharacterized protein n=1 Tax=Trapa incisa TaxID=236973 RepID=A0AAN7PS65_9MYRT|nr:hypothetical protein SAY87_004237 [Trapa incisa]
MKTKDVTLEAVPPLKDWLGMMMARAAEEPSERFHMTWIMARHVNGTGPRTSLERPGSVPCKHGFETSLGRTGRVHIF